MYVGRVRDASDVGRAAWWTHTGPDLSAGWTLHVPDIPATDAEFLDVNAGGVMSGVTYDSKQGFVYDSNTSTFTWLPDFASGHAAWARRINASGVVIGSAADAAGVSYAAIWRPPYAKAERVHAPDESPIITLADGTRATGGSEIDGLNDQGTLVGYTYVGLTPGAPSQPPASGSEPMIQSFTKSARGDVTLLPAGHGQAIGFAVNNNGIVVGSSLREANGGFLPAYWRDGVEQDMGAPANAVAGRAFSVSQGGWAAGGVSLPDAERSFVWTGSGVLQLNEPLPGFHSSSSHGVSDTLRQVAGSSSNIDGTRVPTVWQCSAGFTTG
jgi:hypothetical protein